MNKNYGQKMADLHLRFKQCIEPYLTDEECVELRDFLRIMLDYNSQMGHEINAIYFGMEFERFNNILAARERK